MLSLTCIVRQVRIIRTTDELGLRDDQFGVFFGPLLPM
jgi:hypothetical protein